MSDVRTELDRSITPDEINTVFTSVGWSPYDEAHWADCIQQSLAVVTARVDGQVVGHGFLAGNQRHAQIVDFAVMPMNQHQGVGTQIFKLLMQEAERLEIFYLGLTYAPSTPALITYYEQFGFRVIDFAMWHEAAIARTT